MKLVELKRKRESEGIQLQAQVPTRELKDAALRLVRDEAARIRSDSRIEDRLAIVSTTAQAA